MTNILLLARKISVVYALIALFSIGVAYGEGSEETKDLVVPKFGVVKVPADCNIASVKDLMKLLEAHKDKVSPEKIKEVSSDAKVAADEVEFEAFQLTIEHNNAFNQSWVGFIREKTPNGVSKRFLDGPPNVVQKVNIIQLHDMAVRELDKGIEYIENTASKGSKIPVSLKLLERPPLDFFEVDGNLAASTSLRILVKYGDFIYPVYAKGYFFTVNGCLAAMIVVSGDSDRQFWEPKLNDIIKSFKAEERSAS